MNYHKIKYIITRIQVDETVNFKIFIGIVHHLSKRNRLISLTAI